MKPRKILLFTRPLTPPWDEASKNLAFELSQNMKGNFFVEILTTAPFAKKIKAENRLKEKFFVQINPNPIFFSPQLNFLAKIKLLHRLFRINLNADLIHFLFTPRSLTSFFFQFRLKFFKGKTLLTMATFSDNQKKIKTTQEKQSKKWRKILFFDQIITQSHYSEKKLRKLGFKNVQTIYPGIDLEKFSPQPKNQEVLQTLNLTKENKIILYAGEYLRLGENVVDEIIDAFALLNKNPKKQQLDTKNLRLILAIRLKSKKDKLKKQQLIKKVQRLACSNKIIFLDFFNQMPELYRLSTLNIFPAHKMKGKFDIPYAVLEPMACAKPVIVSDLPILQEFIKNNKTGLVTKSNSPKSLAKSMALLLKNSSLRKKLGLNARQYTEENFDIKNTAKKYAAVYKKL